MEEEVSPELTLMLARVAGGDDTATAELLPLIYDELRALAGSFFKKQDPNHTLQPTALVHEAFIKLTGSQKSGWKNRAHFFAVAAKAMRQFLSNHARRKKTAKRGYGKHRVTLSGLSTPHGGEAQVGLIDLEEALVKLTELSSQQAQIVELRFLAGLNDEEVGHVLGIHPRTVQRNWKMAKAFLTLELNGRPLS